MLLEMNPDQALQFDNNGYTPLHLAAINGNNVFHLTIRFKKFDAFKFVDGILKGTYLFYQPDKFGNTIQHLAQMEGFHQACLSLFLFLSTNQ
ncbi:putative ankyrin repeat-containing domain-containing protein [Helianthus anomalus]